VNKVRSFLFLGASESTIVKILQGDKQTHTLR